MPGASEDALPEVNDLVRVNVAGNAALDRGEAAEGARTRVENVYPGEGADGRTRYVVAAPRYGGDVELPVPGTPCTLEWPGERGVWLLPVSFVVQELVGEGLRVWLVDVIGPARQNERREYVRVGWCVPVTLSLMSAEDVRRAVALGLDEASLVAGAETSELPDSLVGRTRDVSEGGISCLLPAPELPQGLAVTTYLELLGETFGIPSRIARVCPTGEISDHPFAVAVAFDNPARYGDRLRPLLFAEQLRIRRAGLD